MAISRIYVRRDTAQNWESSNVVLNVGEFGYDITNKTVKIGDGTTAWNDLVPIQSVTTNTVTALDQLTDVQISGADHTPSDGQSLAWDEAMGHWMPKEVTNSTYVDQKVLELRTELTSVDSYSPAVDTEYRNLNRKLMGNKAITVTTGDIETISSLGDEVLVYQNENGIWRYLNYIDQVGQGGLDVYKRVDSDGNEITAPIGNEYDPAKSSIGTKSYPYDGLYPLIEIVKTGDYAVGWMDVQDIADRVTVLENSGFATISSYTKSNLPINSADGTTALVTDGTIDGTPTMCYFYNGNWYRTFDNSIIIDQTIDLFILAGQSNARGNADVSDLTSAQATQDGLFYTSWHDTQSDAETTQYYSDWATSLVAGSTRGESSSSTLGNSSYFGPELGFVSRANAINLTTQPIGIIKYAVGGSTLSAGTSTSDWSTTATGTNEGDCYRGLLSALSDATTKLTNAGYSWNFKGMIWWQGESGTSVSGLNTFISAVRTLLGNSYGVSNPSQFPVVITKIGLAGATDLTPVASADANVEIVDAATYGQNSQVHVGNVSEGSSDHTGNGVNDMFDIGEAYADKMASIIAVDPWSPSQLSTTVWLDASDASTITHSSNAVSQWSDKSGNNYHFTQSTTSNNPTTNLSTIGGLNALDFDGLDTPSQADFLRNADVPLSGTHSIFVVMLARSADTDYGRVLENSSGFIFGLGSNETDFITSYRPGPTSPWNDLYTNTPTQSVLNVGIFGVTNDNSTATPYVNGTAQDTKNGVMTALNGMNLGAWTGGDQSFDGIIGEVIITPNKLSDADRQKVEGYLAHKWGLTSDLPESHPYKSSAP